MTLAIDATVGAATSNSYLTIAAADAYFEADPQFAALWALLTEAQKTQRLVSATRGVDTFPFNSEKYSPGQSLQFPRKSQIGDLAAPFTEIPREVRDATCELLICLYHGQDATTGQASRDVDSVTLTGILSVEFGRVTNAQVQRAAGGNVERVTALLRRWIGADNSWDIDR